MERFGPGAAIGLLRRRLSRSGFALLTVLTAIVLMMFLLTALLSNQRSQLSLNRYSTDREVAREAAISMLEYGRFKLEQDQTWLSLDPLMFEPPLDAENNPIFTIDSIERVSGAAEEETFTVRMEGQLNVDREVHFTLLLANNFASEVQADGLDLGPHTGRLDVETSFGSSKVRHIWLLRHAAFADSTVAASGDIQVDTSEVVFATTDHSRNQIRSLQDISLPRVNNMRFSPGGGWQRQEKGRVWAYDDITVGPPDNLTPLDVAAERTGAQFIPNGRSAYRVPKLNLTEVAADPSIDPVRNVPAGEYHVGTRTLEFEDLAGVTHERAIPLLRRRDGTNGTTSLYFSQDILQDGMPPLDPATIRMKGEAIGSMELFPSAGNIVTFGPLRITLTSGDVKSRISLPRDEMVVSNGDLLISGFSASDLPVLEFLAPPNSPPDEDAMGRLEAKGDLTVVCSIENAGLLMASGDVNLFPSDVVVAAEPASDLAICAGGDVNINPSLAEDSGADRDSGGRKLSFKGLVYANGNFNFDTFSGDYSPLGAPINFNRDIEIEGSVVARNGGVNIKGDYGATLRYNPDFLDDVMESSFKSNNRQLEVVSAREM